MKKKKKKDRAITKSTFYPWPGTVKSQTTKQTIWYESKCCIYKPMKDYTETRYQNGSRLYTPKTDMEKPEKENCICHCHANVAYGITPMEEINNTHCTHCKGSYCQKPEKEECLNCERLLPGRRIQVDDVNNPHCIKCGKLINSQKPAQPETPYGERWEIRLHKLKCINYCTNPCPQIPSQELLQFIANELLAQEKKIRKEYEK